MTITHAGPGRPPGIRRGPDGLTDRQRAIVGCIARSVADRGYPPSMREIGQAVGLTSTSSVAHQLLALERKGALRRDPHRPRAYCLPLRSSAGEYERPESEPAAAEVPLVGRIAAGTPILAEEMVEDTYVLPRQFCVNSERVAGERQKPFERPWLTTLTLQRVAHADKRAHLEGRRACPERWLPIQHG